jgi:hypothetical protein
MYGFVGWELLIAFWSKLFHIAPAVLAHTVIQPFLIILAYFAVYNIGKKVVKKQSAVVFFILTIAMMNLIGSCSGYTQAAFLLDRIWQGKSILVNIILPVLTAVCIELYRNIGKRISRLLIYASIVMLAGICASVMGDYLIPLLFSVLMLSFAFCIGFRATLKSIIPVMLALLPPVFYLMLNFVNQKVYALPDIQNTNNYISILKNFSGPHYVYVILLLLSLVYMFFRGDKIHKALFGYFSLLLILIFLNPLSGYYFLHKQTLSAVYWRLFWLLPIYPAIAFVVSDILSGMEKVEESIFSLICLCFVFAYSGNYMYSADRFAKPENSYKLPQAAIDISNYIDKDSGEKDVCAIMPDALSPKIRQYDAKIAELWFRGSNYDNQETRDQISTLHSLLYSSGMVDGEAITQYMNKFDLKYIILPLNASITNDPQSEFILKVMLDQYNIYKYEQK